MTTIFQIQNPFTGDIIFVGRTTDYELRKQAYRYYSNNDGLGHELRDIYDGRKEPIFKVLDTSPDALAPRVYTAWVHRLIENGCKLHNKIAPRNAKRKHRGEDIAFCDTFEFTLHLPNEIKEHPVFKERTKSIGYDRLNAYVGILILKDLADEGTILDDYIVWINS